MVRPLIVLLCLTACTSPKAGPKEKAMIDSAQDSRRSLLERLLAEPDLDSKAASELLLRHGPITADEVPTLSQRAASGGEAGRLAAVRLLSLSRAPEARPALRKVAADAKDGPVVALALGSLPGEGEDPDGKTLAWSKAELLRGALSDPRPDVAAAALRAAWWAGLPGVAAQMAQRLDQPDDKAKAAVLGLLARAGAGPLEPKVRELVLDPKTPSHQLADLYQALSHSDDPATADALRRSLEGANLDRETAFANGLFLGKSRKPWLKAMLLGMAQKPGKMRWTAFDQLAKWGEDAPAADLVKTCADYLESVLPKERVKRRPGDADLESCHDYLGALAGHPFPWDEMYLALDFAKGWLKDHAQKARGVAAPF